MHILIADNRSEVRSALRLLLEQEPGVKVTADVGDVWELLAAFGKNRPGILLLDWQLDGLLAAELIPVLRSLCPELRIIALCSRPEIRREALSAGVDDFVSKADSPESLLAAIKRVGSEAAGPA